MRLILSCAVLLSSAAVAQTVQPGMWETTSTTKSANMPDMPAFLAKRLQGHTVTVKHCITPEEAAQGPKQMIAQQKSCSIDHYNMSGGRFDAKLICSGTTVTSAGSYTPVSMSGDSHVSGPNGVDMTAHVESRRTGSC